jgi:hypothetical protein
MNLVILHRNSPASPSLDGQEMPVNFDHVATWYDRKDGGATILWGNDPMGERGWTDVRESTTDILRSLPETP